MKRKSVCDQIVDSITEKIKNGELKPGDSLPNEVEMAEQYGVSRVSLREALRYLSAKGLVVVKHGEGAFVREYQPEFAAETLYGYTLLDTSAVIEVLELRKIMESEAARLCCQNATPEEIRQIRHYKEKREACLQAGGDALPADGKKQYDTLFHEAIAAATHNELFSRFIQTIRKTIEFHQENVAAEAAGVRNTTYFHDEITKAIEARDGDRAAKMMSMHIVQVQEAVTSNLLKHGQGQPQGARTGPGQ